MTIQIEQPQQQRLDEVALAVGKKIGQDWREHVEDDVRGKRFEWHSCLGCGLMVRHEGYCHKCAS